MSNDCQGFGCSTKISDDDCYRLVNDSNINDIDDLKNYVVVKYPTYSDKDEDDGDDVKFADDTTKLAKEEDMKSVKKIENFTDAVIVNKSSESNQPKEQPEEKLKLILKLFVICTLIMSLSIILTSFGRGAEVVNDIGKSTLSVISLDENIDGQLQKVYADIENEKQKQNELIYELSSMYNNNEKKKKSHASADNKMMKISHIQQKYGATRTKSSSSSDSRLKEMKKIAKVHNLHNPMTDIAHEDDHHSTHHKKDRLKYIHNHRYTDNYHGTTRQGKQQQQQMKPYVKKTTGSRSGTIDNVYTKNGMFDEIDTEIIASRELLHVLGGEYIDVTYDNFESFLDIQTQPAGSINRVVLVFYKSTNAQSTSTIVDQVTTLLSEIDGFSIGLIDCSNNQLLCNNNYIQSYPTIRVYRQRLPKLNSSGKKVKYLRYVYTTVATIDEIKNERSITNSNKKEIVQYPTMMMQQQHKINRGSGGLVSEKRRLHKKRVYPQMETNAVHERNHDTKILNNDNTSKESSDDVPAELDNGSNVNNIVVLNYKNFYNFFIGETKVNKNRILMVFYTPSHDFTNIIAPILNKLAVNDHHHHVGVVNCNLYETICRSHSITDFPTMRWYSTHADDGMNNNTTTAEENKEQKALWYETTTQDELLELLLLEEQNNDSQSPMI